MYDYQHYSSILYSSLSTNQSYVNYVAEYEGSGNQIRNQINRIKYEAMQNDIQKFLNRTN